MGVNPRTGKKGQTKISETERGKRKRRMIGLRKERMVLETVRPGSTTTTGGFDSCICITRPHPILLCSLVMVGKGVIPTRLERGGFYELMVMARGWTA